MRVSMLLCCVVAELNHSKQMKIYGAISLPQFMWPSPSLISHACNGHTYVEDKPRAMMSKDNSIIGVRVSRSV